MSDPATVGDAALDLVRGSSCLGCGRRGRMLCSACALTLPATGHVTWPEPTPAGLVPPYAATAYAGTVRAMLVAHKEHQARELRRSLAGLLAVAVAAALADRPGSGDDLTLVPVPSRPGVTRRRGDDPTGALVLGAARRLGALGHVRVRVARLLVSGRGVRDQAGLGAAQRAANLAGTMHAPAHLVAGLARTTARTLMVVCDDVLTTGATLREAQRALEAVGLRPAAVAVVAATPRRTPAQTRVG